MNIQISRNPSPQWRVVHTFSPEDFVEWASMRWNRHAAFAFLQYLQIFYQFQCLDPHLRLPYELSLDDMGWIRVRGFFLPMHPPH